jgi:hypothetical protein
MRKSRNAPAEPLTLTGLLADFRLLVILFVAFRLLLLMVWQPLIVNEVERGVSAGGDFAYYFALASLTEDGLMPFRDWWHEFPPLTTYLFVAIYWLGGAGNYSGFAMLFGMIMLAFDVGNLILLRRIATHLYNPNTGMSLVWIYALMLAPMVFLWWNFEPMVVFSLLLGLWWLLRGRDVPAAVAAGIGALTKFIPALLLGAVWRFRQRSKSLKYALILLGVFALVYGYFFVLNSEMTTPSLTAQFNKSSYQTVWALLDGNYITGNFGSVQSHLDPAAATVLQGNPAVIPGFVRLAAAGAIGLAIFLTTNRFDDRGFVAFVAVTVFIFFLQSQGWSVQWLGQIIPLMLLCFPTRNGVLILVLLSLTVFAEYPLLFIRTGDTGGVISGALVPPFTILVLARTAILVGMCVALYRKLRQEPLPSSA